MSMPHVQQGPARYAPPKDLTPFAWLSIAVALVTIVLKLGAWWITDSVGLLSDAAESGVNLIAAVTALIVLRIAMRPPDPKYPYGRSKVEYFSAALEGSLILVAGVMIIIAAAERLINPRPLSNLGIGLGISVVAAVLNGIVAQVLISAGKRHGSITLTADGKHLRTDLITTAAILVGVFLVWVTQWSPLDPIVAILAGLNILYTGVHLVREAYRGLMDAALPADQQAEIHRILDRFSSDEIQFHAIRTRRSGSREFVEMHMLMPGEWSVQYGHDLAEDVTHALTDEFPELRVMCHTEPIEDPKSYQDIDI